MVVVVVWTWFVSSICEMVPSGRDRLWWMDRKRGGEEGRETRVKLVVEVRLPWEIIAGCEYADLVNSLPCNPWMNGRDKTVNDRNCVTVSPFWALRDDIWRKRKIPIFHKLKTLVLREILTPIFLSNRLIWIRRGKQYRNINIFFVSSQVIKYIDWWTWRKSSLKIFHLRYLFHRYIPSFQEIFVIGNHRFWKPNTMPVTATSNLPSFMTVSRPQTRQVPGSVRGNSRVENACFLESFQPGIYLRFALDH